MDVESAGAAVARQAAWEAQLLSAAESSLRYFLLDVADRAWREKSIYPPTVAQLWANAVVDITSSLPADVAEYVADAFKDSDIPDDVYASTIAVLQAATQTFATDDQLHTELNRVLSADGFAVEQISASSEPIDFPEDALTAAGFWDSLSETGSVWIKRIRRVTRTSATGLSGWITVTAIRIQDYPMKRWVTRHDANVRHTHREVDGETVPVNEPFIVGGVPLMYPGERNAEYGEIVNCRCVLTGVK